MGCWNGTCGLTSLPILNNEEVYVFILEDRGNGIILPCLLPIRAKYNDYGGFKDVTGIGYDYILKALKENIVEQPLGENEYHDIEVTKDKLDLELINDAIHEGRLIREYSKLKGFETDKPIYSKQESNIDRMLVRKDVLDYYLSNFKNDYGYFDVNREYIKKEYDFNTLIEGIREHVRFIEVEKHEEYSLLFKENMSDWLEDLILLKRTKDIDNSSPNLLIYDYFHNMCDGVYDSNLLNFNKIVTNYYREGNYKEILILLEELIIGLVLNRLVMLTRKSWRHGVGDGSQSVCKEDYMILNEATKLAIDKLP